jgi:hypothetical protein
LTREAGRIGPASRGLNSLKFANATDGLFATFTPRALVTARSTGNDLANYVTYIESGFVIVQIANVDPSTGAYVDGDVTFAVTDLDFSGAFCSIIIFTPSHQAPGANATTTEKTAHRKNA